MTQASLPSGRFAVGDFRIGKVFSRAWSVFSRNFVTFMLVIGIANLPSLLLTQPDPAASPMENLNPTFFLVLVLTIVLSTLGQAMVLYGAFQDMRGRPVRLADCFTIGLRRLFPIVGLTIVMVLALGLAAILLIFPAVMLAMMWFVATPVCVVEQVGPLRSMGRSRELTKGHRWRIFGMLLVIVIPAMIVGAIVGFVTVYTMGPGGFLTLGAVLASWLGKLVGLVWKAAWGGFFAAVVAVTYHDLRVAKEGLTTEQIASVFE
jgi:MFS family permease